MEYSVDVGSNIVFLVLTYLFLPLIIGLILFGLGLWFFRTYIRDWIDPTGLGTPSVNSNYVILGLVFIALLLIISFT